MAKDILLEIGTEEIPAKFMPGALKQLARRGVWRLSFARLTNSRLTSVVKIKDLL